MNFLAKMKTGVVLYKLTKINDQTVNPSTSTQNKRRFDGDDNNSNKKKRL